MTEVPARMKIIAFRERNAIESFISGVTRASLSPSSRDARVIGENHSPDKYIADQWG